MMATADADGITFSNLLYSGEDFCFVGFLNIFLVNTGKTSKCRALQYF